MDKKQKGHFAIDAAGLKWIDGKIDNRDDLCLHGLAIAKIGERVLEFDETTVSATALYLLKTVTENHIIYEDNQMLPCCGHFLIPDDELSGVHISGCDNGVDWSVIHDGDSVRLVLEDGYDQVVPMEDYISEVKRFADKIEAFYDAAPPRILPKDKFDRDGYTAFWNEWHRRRKEME